MDRELVRISKFLSLVLRHHPQAINLSLDPEGWLDINELIENAQRSGTKISLATLHEVVATSDKQRFALSDDGLRIRANQGHSIAGIDLNLSPTLPPDQLFHGTVGAFLNSIRSQGLLKRSRNHVHLSADKETATRVAARRGTPVILTIESQEMREHGYEFYLSENSVWLTDHVPSSFIQFPD